MGTIWVKAPQVSYVNEIVELVKVFYPEEQVTSSSNEDETFGFGHTDIDLSEVDMLLEAGYEEIDTGFLVFTAFLWENGSLLCKHRNIKSNKNPQLSHTRDQVHINSTDNRKTNRVIKNGIKGCVFDLLKTYTGKHPKWGALTGIRPVKLVHELGDRGLDQAMIKKQLLDVYKLHPEKADLLLQTARIQLPLLDNRENREVSLYIHIPFCSSRCYYCSFPSDLISRVSDKMGEYLECLERELSAVMEGLKAKGTNVDTVYVGGGTPTVLGHFHLESLLKMLKGYVLDMCSIREYTVEAGRPDSLDRAKIELMKEFGVTRLSINPQTMNQETLDLIGRNHTVEELVKVFKQAREVGFDCINMDVILGLPGETPEHINHTMQEIAGLNPENITVHTLAVKRASAWKESFQQYDDDRKGLAEEMADIFRKWIGKLGMVPYYLYRQKYMLDHLENIGYALPGKECLYNIQFMDEKRDIWAIGAGASSKIYYPREDRLERIANVKNLDVYLARIEEMIEKKRKVLESS
jgi:coproporphyrinogen dehydrogenase HemZ